MALPKISTLVSTFPGPGLPPEWLSYGSPASVAGNAVAIPASTDSFVTRISTAAFYDPTSSSIFGKLQLSTPRSYTTTNPAPTFTGYNRIGSQQPGGVQCKTLLGIIPGATVGQQAHAQMKPTMDALATKIGTQVEAVGVGMPNQMGDCSKVLDALYGETRFIRFAVPMVPHAIHSGDTVGSITDLLNGVYDAKIIDMVTKMVAAGFGGDNVSSSVGWEYNAGAGKSLTSGYEWATNYGDPRTGVANGISQVHLAQAYFENLMRTHGYTGWIEWNGGNNDTSALPIQTAMPTHATTWKSKTLWGWDLYPSPPYNAGKNNLTATINATNSIYNTYLAWCKTNGYLMAHGEWGVTYSASSPYSLQQDQAAGWITWFYKKLADNASQVVYAMLYQQNQPYTPGNVLDEAHQLWFFGGVQGVKSTTVGSGPYPVGSSNVNTAGPANTAATMGTYHNVADTGTIVFTDDPNKTNALTGFLQNFGGITYQGVTGKGAAGLGVPYVASSSITQGPIAQVVLTPGAAHNPAVAAVLEFDYNQTLSMLTTGGVDGAAVTTGAAPTSIWWKIADDGTNITWQTSVDATTWTTLRTAPRPSWWNATDGVSVSIISHNADGTQTISPLTVSNINTTTNVVSSGPDLAIFDKFNISPAPPPAVINLQAHVSGNQVTLTWNPPVQGITQGYNVSAQPLNSASPALPSQTVTATAAAFLNVPSNGSYVFIVAPFNSAGTGPAVATSAVTISGSGAGSAGGPTPALGAAPNALPINPIPSLYRPLVLTMDPDDGDSLAMAALQRQAELIGQGWRPYAANPDVAALQVAAYMAADLRQLVRDAGAAAYAGFGQQVLQNPQLYDAPSQIVTTWTALDDVGHVIPAGTQVSYPGSGSTPLTFTTRGDITINTGETQATDIVMLSDQTGAYTNNVPAGPLEVQGSIIWLDNVVATSAATGGQDAESDEDYRNRLVGFTRQMGQTLVLPMDYAYAAQQASTAVYRAYAVPNYDATSPSPAAVDRAISVFLLNRSGLPVAGDVATDVQARLAAKREANFRVIVTDGSGNAVAPGYVNVSVTATVVTSTGFSQAAVKAACEQVLTDYLDPATWDGGLSSPPTWSGRTVIRPHDLAAQLTLVPGVDHVDALAIGGGAVKITGTDNYQLSPSSFSKAVLPAGTYSNSHWTTPSSVVVTANAPAS